jgi:hypothetical protein
MRLIGNRIRVDREEMVMVRMIGRLFGRDHARYEGVSRINICLLRALFALMIVVLGRDVWTHIAAHEGPWDPDEAVAWSVWAAFSVLAVVGLVRPLAMLPLVLLEIAYKLVWLILVAYPLWAEDRLAGSPAEERTYAFLWVVLPIVAVPWRYAFDRYVRGRARPADPLAAT